MSPLIRFFIAAVCIITGIGACQFALYHPGTQFGLSLIGGIDIGLGLMLLIFGARR